MGGGGRKGGKVENRKIGKVDKREWKLAVACCPRGNSGILKLTAKSTESAEVGRGEIRAFRDIRGSGRVKVRRCEGAKVRR